MAVMVGRPFGAGPERKRLKTLTHAALNADLTVGQLEGVLANLGTSLNELNTSLSQLNITVERLNSGLDHLEGTLSSLDDLARRLRTLVGPAAAIVERLDAIMSLGEVMLAPLAVTEHALRGALDLLRNRTLHDGSRNLEA